jgi:hypothetical protein
MNGRDTVRLIMEDMMNLFPDARVVKIAFVRIDVMVELNRRIDNLTELQIQTALEKVKQRLAL